MNNKYNPLSGLIYLSENVGKQQNSILKLTND